MKPERSAIMDTTVAPPVRMLLVDDFKPWRDKVCSMLEQRTDLLIVGQAADGLEAVLKAQELQPDLILLDIGLPSLDGLKASIQIRQLIPSAKILFLTQNADADIAQAAMSAGAQGYVVKADAGRELLPAIAAVLRSERLSAAD